MMVDHDPIGYVDIQHTSCLNFNMPYYKWNYEKNERLKAGRGVCFEQVVLHIEQGDLLDVVEHPNKFKYPNQHVLIVKIESYVLWLKKNRTKKSGNYPTPSLPSLVIVLSGLRQKKEKVVNSS
ncbi:MAG TPA: hypothetical protein ENN79_06820, partial [Desulfobacteraceae bacterium]|nr:hypothetical protein [Desulfobacteraceae bacterium]